MPKFMNKSELYRLLQRELPPDAYPDGAASAYFSTADMGSVAKTLESSQNNLSRIYENYFPQTADENIVDWEIIAFGYTLDPAFNLAQRRSSIVSKLRAHPLPTPGDLRALVLSIIGTGSDVEIVEWGNSDGAWILDESQLEISTILSGYNRMDFVGPDLCSFEAADFGLTEDQYLEMRQEAYTYEVRIYSQTLTSQQRVDLDKALTKGELSRSQHIILDGLDPADHISGST